ncbi:MAG: hypothetical protein JST75_18960 [Bacteroidetes bacterium]|nr:hypothetical protein [Bacteroidota bacterium]
MKKQIFISLLLIAGISPSCKKYIQQQQQNALESVITNGTWIVTRYVENGSDITPSFSGYVFKFNSDGTVTGTKASNVDNGTWSGNVSNKTITSDFPSAATPIDKLNAVWKITDSYVDSVAASTTINANTNILNLHKQ